MLVQTESQPAPAHGPFVESMYESILRVRSADAIESLHDPSSRQVEIRPTDLAVIHSIASTWWERGEVHRPSDSPNVRHGRTLTCESLICQCPGARRCDGVELNIRRRASE